VVARNQNVDLFIGNYKNFLHTFFYTLNEEIILGALFLKGIQHYRKKTPAWIISVGVAVCFTIIHFVFFQWIFDNRGPLGVFTLLSLLAVGIARNNLILRTGHIGYSWALHFGWVYIMLGSSHYQRITEHYLTDFERFEVYLGDVRVMGVCIALAIATFMKFKKTTSF
jgi:membrane protease YdiL (CAAX protease family)